MYAASSKSIVGLKQISPLSRAYQASALSQNPELTRLQELIIITVWLFLPNEVDVNEERTGNVCHHHLTICLWVKLTFTFFGVNYVSLLALKAAYDLGKSLDLWHCGMLLVH